MTDGQSLMVVIIRITKNPEERKNEFIDIAEQLFIEKGYENTAVSDIVKKAQVAKGTFYYYFKTKEDILDHIIDRYITFNTKGMQTIANEQDISALEKLVKLLLFSSSFRNNRKSIIQYIHEDKNAHLHLKFERELPTMIVAPLSTVIKQGIQEEVFNTKFSEEAAKAFIGVSAMILQGVYNIKPDSAEYKRMLLATIYFLERILGAEPGLIINAYKKIGEIQ